jgi:hypothetical protein
MAAQQRRKIYGNDSGYTDIEQVQNEKKSFTFR